MKLHMVSLAFAALLMSVSADATFGRGGGGGGGGGGGYRAPSGGMMQRNSAPANNQGAARAANTNSQGAQSHTTYYHSPANVDRNKSVLFGKNGAFGNTSAGNSKFNSYGNYGAQPVMGGKVGTSGTGVTGPTGQTPTGGAVDRNLGNGGKALGGNFGQNNQTPTGGAVDRNLGNGGKALGPVFNNGSGVAGAAGGHGPVVPPGGFGAYGGVGGYGGHGPVVPPGGFGGYGGYGGYGLGYGYGGAGFLPFLGGLGLGYGLGGAFGGYGGYGAGGAGYANTPTDGGQAVATDPQAQPALADTAANAPTSHGTDYVMLGETDFRSGKYEMAIGAFRHALVDEPNNAGLMMLTAQALFQTGKWTQAAAATELAMGALPEDKWGVVVQNYTQIYGNVGDYTGQLKALEAAVKQQPDDPALRFLLGFQYGYLKYPQQAVRELGKAVELEGRDPAARRLHDLFAAQTGAPQVGPVPQPEAPNSGSPAPPADKTDGPAAS